MNRATSIRNPRQSLNEEQEYSIINEINMESIQNNYENKTNNELTRQDESWKMATSNKKRKVTPCTSSRKAIVANKQEWLQEINLRNSFSTLPGEKVTDPVEKPITCIAKPPPIYIDAQIIDPLIELLNNTAGKENYSIKQLKVVQVKVRTNILEIFRKVTKALKEKNAEYHTYQLKADRSYKAVIRGLHPKTNANNICEELAKI